MIKKINDLKSKVDSIEVKKLCENAISTISSTTYNEVTPEARLEIEKITINNLFEQLSKYKQIKNVNEWIKNQKRLFNVKYLGIREAINSLNESEELNEVLETFKNCLNRGVHEACLYEQFITALSPFGYFPTVGNAIKSVKDRVDTYKNDVDIVKIIETMKETRSNYLVPLIEDVINNYLASKTTQTKSQLSETLMKFTYDPFVRDIVSLVTLDATELQLESANVLCDIEKVFSPVLYIGENEAVFAVNKEYYLKKGNNISRLPEVDIFKLDNEFKTLCETLVNPNIVIGKNDITVYCNKDKAVISEKSIIVNEQVMTLEQFKNTESICEWTGNKIFYKLVEFLRSNYNEIAEIDFVKRVYLKENEQHSANVFKLRDNVFITTHNPELGKTTFYRNVNPIQAKNIMMEHLHYDVTSLYKNLLPDEEKINEEINETKKEYNDYINELQKRINEFRLNSYGKEINEQVIETLEEELHDIKNEYKDYLNKIEKYRRAESINEDITVDINVDGKKYTVPIPKDASKKEVEDKSQEGGAEVGKENIEDVPASAITFDNEQTELLSDTPSIPEDKIDMESDKVEQEAEDAEKEAEEKEEEESDELKDNVEKDDEISSDDNDDIKIEDEVDSDQEDKDELKAKDEDKEKKKKQKLESSEGTRLNKTKFLKESGEKKKKRVFLKKKIVENSNSIKKKNNLRESFINENIDEYAFHNFFQITIEGTNYIIVVNPDGRFLTFDFEGNNIDNFSKETIDKNTSSIKQINTVPDTILNILPNYIMKSKDAADALNKAWESMPKDLNDKEKEDLFTTGMKQINDEENNLQTLKNKEYSNMSQSELNNALDKAIKVKDWGRVKEISKYLKESLKINESAQIGDTVLYNKQKGNIIGQIGNDLIVQVQGSSYFVNPNEVKVKNIKAETLKPPFKFSKETQKLLFEQYTKCGIFMGNIPVKTNNCYVRYSDWNDAKDNEPINIIVEGQLSLHPKNQIRIFEDINNFANLDNYVDGVQINLTTGDALENVRINVKDYIEALGDADPVRIIRRGDEENPIIDTVPKEMLRTLSV